MIPWLTSSSRVRLCWSLSWRTAWRQRRRGETKEGKRESAKAGEDRKLQFWSFVLLKRPYCLLLSTEQQSIYQVWINNHVLEPRRFWADMKRTQFILPFPPSSLVLFFFFFEVAEEAVTRRAWAAYDTLPVSGLFFILFLCAKRVQMCVWKKKTVGINQRISKRAIASTAEKMRETSRGGKKSNH